MFINFGLVSLVLVTGIGRAVAQQMSINNLPSCADTCAQTAANAVGCTLSDSDRTCLCSHPSFSTATQDCGRSSCPREDIGTVGFVLNQFCSGVETSSAASSTTPAASSSSSSSSTPSSASSSSSTSKNVTPSATSTSAAVTGSSTTNTPTVSSTVTNNAVAQTSNTVLNTLPGLNSIIPTGTALSSGPSTVNVVQTLTVDSDGNPLNPTGLPSSAMAVVPGGLAAKGMVGLVGAVVVAGLCMCMGRL